MKNSQVLETTKQKIDDLDLGFLVMFAVKKYSWNKEQALRVIDQLKNFLFLRYKYPETNYLVPSETIEKIWKIYILNTTEYVSMCDSIFGCYLHIFNHVKNGAKSNDSRYLSYLKKTQKLYFDEFQEYMTEEKNIFWRRVIAFFKTHKVYSLFLGTASILGSIYISNYVGVLNEAHLRYNNLKTHVKKLYYTGEQSYLICSLKEEYQKQDFFLNELLDVMKERRNHLMVVMDERENLEEFGAITKKALKQVDKLIRLNGKIYLLGFNMCSIKFPHPSDTIEARKNVTKILADSENSRLGWLGLGLYFDKMTGRNKPN